MKKILWKSMAVLLCLSLLLSFMPLFAGAAYEEDQDYSIYPELAAISDQDAVYPTIILPGINHSNTYLADENGEPVKNRNDDEISGGLLLIDGSSVIGDVLALLPHVLFSLILQRTTAGLKDAVYSTVQNVLGIQQMDQNGETVQNLVTDFYDYPVSEMDEGTRSWFYRMIPMEPFADLFGEDKIYLYTFPLYGNPMDAAYGLHDYIDLVKAQTGAEKVNLISISLGGTILSAFMDTEPDLSEINQILNIVSLMNGTDLMADFMARRFNLSDQFLYSDFIPMIMKESTGSATTGYLINILLRILPKQSLYDVLTAAFSSLLDTVILNDPQFWAMLPADEYEALADRYLRDGAHDVLLEKTDRYQEARVQLNENLTAAKKAGIDIYNISGYGLSFTDGEYNFFGIVASSATVNSDAIIPIDSSTLGATAAPAGQKLDEAYLQNADSAYISPDQSVDASTCLFPETTWFINKQHHEVGRNDVVIRLACAILGGLVTDIHSMPMFPQFMQTRNTRALVRSDSGYIFKAQRVLFGEESANYTAEQKAAIQKAYDDVLVMLADPSVAGDDAQVPINALYNAMAAAGIYAPVENDSQYESLLEFLMKKLNDYFMFRFGGQGYSDYAEQK